MKRLLVTLSIAAFVFSGFYGEAFAMGNGTTTQSTNNSGTYGTYGTNGYGTNGYGTNGTTNNGRNYNYSTRAAAADRTDWGWLGLLGLVGLAGLAGRNRDRSNIK